MPTLRDLLTKSVGVEWAGRQNPVCGDRQKGKLGRLRWHGSVIKKNLGMSSEVTELYDI